MEIDRYIEKKKWTTKRITLFVAASIFGILLIYLVFSTVGKSRLNVDSERITISEVLRGNFREFIPVTGVIQPISTIYLDLQEGGRIEEIFAEDGAVVAKGQPILRLSNNDLELSLTNQETQVYNLLAQVQIAQNGARQNTISKLTQSIDVENQLIEAERVYRMNQQLLASHVVAQQEYQESENYYNYLLKKKDLMTEILIQDSIASMQQLQQAEQSYRGAQNGLMLMRGKFADLTVSAPVDGQLTSLDAEIGQSKGKGERIGQIDVLSGFKVRVDVDEHYISRIYAGLEGQYRQGNTVYPLTITKVYTQVTSGIFAVDMEFSGEMPETIRRGQTLQIRIALGDESEAIIIPRGGFYQNTGGSWIFKLSEDGKTALRTPVRIGRQNPDHYEVLEGLNPGDRVIVNSYENYGDAQELIIKD